MISSTFGAPLGGTTVGGQKDLESLASFLITPPNFTGGGGSCFPSTVMVALGDPSSPVTCCAVADATASAAAIRDTALNIRFIRISLFVDPVSYTHLRAHETPEHL